MKKCDSDVKQFDRALSTNPPIKFKSRPFKFSLKKSQPKGSFHIEQSTPDSYNTLKYQDRIKEISVRRNEIMKFSSNHFVHQSISSSNNFNNTISGWLNLKNSKNSGLLTQKAMRHSSQNFTGSQFHMNSNLNIPKIGNQTKPINNKNIFVMKNIQKSNVETNSSQTFSQNNNKSNFDKTKHISSNNYTTSTEHITEAENTRTSTVKGNQDDILINLQRQVKTENEIETNENNNKNFQCVKIKNKLKNAKIQAEYFDDNKIKQIKFEKNDEDEEINFIELCNAFKNLM